MATAGRAGRLMEPLRAGIAVVLVAAAVGLVGCTPGPGPKPTPTPLFTSEAEAFKAAEQVYRDYVDAANANRNGIETPDSAKFLIGGALESSIDSARELHKQGLTLSGDIKLIWFSGVGYDSASSKVEANACVDVSGTRVKDSSGSDVTPASRPLTVPLNLQFDRSADGMLAVSSSMSGKSQCEAR
ncbi:MULTISPECIES: hypothetical protein [unclassified Microbacterium]|uniref:hypothetical protein n=1 Tax=unclassified Microbacterium TaxID=2609290 RepID=UPI0036690CC9